MRRMSAKWMPRLLIMNQKRERIRTSQYCLDMFKRNAIDFTCPVMTIDKT